MANNHQYPGIQPFQHPNASSIDLPRGFAPPMNFQFHPTIQALSPEPVARLSSQNFQCVGRGGTVLNIGYPPQSYAPHLMYRLQILVCLALVALGTLFFSGSRAPPQVTGPSSHSQAQHRASISQTTAQSSILNPTFEQPKRADARTDWKEHSSPDGRKYYYNKITKQSTWTMPDEMKIAREQAENASLQGPHAEGIIDVSKVLTRSDTASTAAPTSLPSQTSTSEGSEKLALTSDWKQPASVPGSSSPVENVDRVQMIADETSQLCDTSETDGPSVPVTKTSAATLVEKDEISVGNNGDSDDMSATNANWDWARRKPKPMVESERVESQTEEKQINQENFSFNNKSEAGDVFKSLLKSANVGSDWTWEQAMREIINDRRYGALRTLGERKQAFNEFLLQTKRAAEEERLARQRKRYEDFKRMLEECVELTPPTRWSKAVTMFEEDERFKALEREKDRRNIFEDHVSELKEKERVKALEDRKRNIIEYRRFLESCNIIKPNSQWRKVQDRLEVDERCSRLEKIDQLEIFQEYLRDLEREEEEKKKIQKVKDLPVYSAIASNSSGATPKDLFEDAVEDLKKRVLDYSQ
ncbi:unnamed protein product [Arabidopsis arenosa]|uniref:Uncharacterized protein n=1 Tax=Arabidopsis arenosa TaxID=38785 RepID=A0A8S2B7M5_ARAAE|nr:unnamed protein product [Arabidopsis arenosa]